jgi:hypothetical protein
MASSLPHPLEFHPVALLSSSVGVCQMSATYANLRISFGSISTHCVIIAASPAQSSVANLSFSLNPEHALFIATLLCPGGHRHLPAQSSYQPSSSNQIAREL